MIHPYTAERITDLRTEYHRALHAGDTTLCWLLRTSATRAEERRAIDQAADDHLREVAHKAGHFIDDTTRAARPRGG